MMKILVVDTDRIKLAMLSLCLQEMYPDGQIIEFNDAMLSVKYGFNHQIDAVYTNVAMRHITGFQVMELLRKAQPGILVNFVTDTAKYQEMAKLKGADGYYLLPDLVSKNKCTQPNPAARCSGQL